MANVRLLRQQVDAYQRALEGVNREYKADYNTYAGKVDAYNAEVDAVKAGGAAWMPVGDGKYNLFRGVDGSLVPVYTEGQRILDSLPPANVGPNTVVVKEGGVVNSYTRFGPDQKWNKVGLAANVGKPVLAAEPIAPEEPDAPNGPRFTEKEKGLLMNPTAGPAEMVAANAKGVAVTSSLAGDEEPTKNSAFANPEDPNNLKDRGVLARVLGGQL